MAERQKKDGRDPGDSRRSVYRIVSKTAGAGMVVLLVILLYLAIVKGYQLGYQLFSTQEYEETVGITVSFTVEEGESAGHVADKLEKDGLIADAFVFRMQTILFQKRIYAGTYELGDGMSSREILEVLSHTE